MQSGQYVGFGSITPSPFSMLRLSGAKAQMDVKKKQF
jgi:hypothetical protein